MADMTAVTLTTAARSSCARCGTRYAASSRFCSACGTALADSVRAPLDLATRRTIQFGALTVAANIVVGAATFGVVYLVSDAPRLVTAALLLEALHVLVVGALALQTLRFGVRAVQAGRDARTRRSAWPVLGIVVAALVLISLLVSFGLVAAMDLGAL
jgi:ribosomal protein L37E